MSSARDSGSSSAVGDDIDIDAILDSSDDTAATVNTALVRNATLVWKNNIDSSDAYIDSVEFELKNLTSSLERARLLADKKLKQRSNFGEERSNKLDNLSTTTLVQELVDEGMLNSLSDINLIKEIAGSGKNNYNIDDSKVQNKVQNVNNLKTDCNTSNHNGSVDSTSSRENVTVKKETEYSEMIISDSVTNINRTPSIKLVTDKKTHARSSPSDQNHNVSQTSLNGYTKGVSSSGSIRRTGSQMNHQISRSLSGSVGFAFIGTCEGISTPPTSTKETHSLSNTSLLDYSENEENLSQYKARPRKKMHNRTQSHYHEKDGKRSSTGADTSTRIGNRLSTIFNTLKSNRLSSGEHHKLDSMSAISDTSGGSSVIFNLEKLNSSRLTKSDMELESGNSSDVEIVPYSRTNSETEGIGSGVGRGSRGSIKRGISFTGSKVASHSVDHLHQINPVVKSIFGRSDSQILFQKSQRLRNHFNRSTNSDLNLLLDFGDYDDNQMNKLECIQNRNSMMIRKISNEQFFTLNLKNKGAGLPHSESSSSPITSKKEKDLRKEQKTLKKQNDINNKLIRVQIIGSTYNFPISVKNLDKVAFLVEQSNSVIGDSKITHCQTTYGMVLNNDKTIKEYNFQQDTILCLVEL